MLEMEDEKDNKDDGKFKNEKNDYDDYKDEKKRIAKVLENNKPKKRKNEIVRAFALVTQLGIQMACCIVIGVILGIFLDRLLGTAPLFIITLSILGSAAAIKVLYDISKDWKD